MEEIKRLKAELKIREKELKRRDALKDKAKKFADKMREIQAKDKVLFYYYRTTCQGHEGFRSDEPITEKDYYLEFFDYLANSEDANWAQVYFNVGSKWGDQPSLQDLIDICVLFNIPFDEKVLTKTYKEVVYNQSKFGCDICLEIKPVLFGDGEYTFRQFKKKNEDGTDYVNACNCKVLVCNECCPKLGRKCPTCREKFTANCGLDEEEIRKIKPLAEGENLLDI